MAASPRAVAQTTIVALGTATALGVVFTAQAYLVAEPGTLRFWFTFVTQGMPWWTWAVMVPLVFGALNRWSPLEAGTGRIVIVHTVLGIVASGVQAVTTALSVQWLGLAWVGAPALAVIRAILVLRFFSNLVIFGLIAALFHVRRHIEALRASRERIRWIERRRADGIRKLAGAVGHDFSNRLTVVTSLWSLLRDEVGGLSDEVRAEAREMDDALLAIRDVARHVSTIGMSGGFLALRPQSASKVVDRVVENLGPHLATSVDTDVRAGALDAAVVAVDLDRLGEVARVLSAFLQGTSEEDNATRAVVRLVRRPLSDAPAGRSDVHRHGFLEITLARPSGGFFDARAFEPRLVTSEGAIRTTLGLTAARATIMRMGGELSQVEGRHAGFLIALPLAHEE